MSNDLCYERFKTLCSLIKRLQNILNSQPQSVPDGGKAVWDGHDRDVTAAEGTVHTVAVHQTSDRLQRVSDGRTACQLPSLQCLCPGRSCWPIDLRGEILVLQKLVLEMRSSWIGVWLVRRARATPVPPAGHRQISRHIWDGTISLQ